MKNNPYDVFSVSETWLEPSISNAKISLAGCSVVRMDRCEKIGGGTAIYVCDSFPFKTHSDLMINELENCMIEVLRPKTNTGRKVRFATQAKLKKIMLQS